MTFLLGLVPSFIPPRFRSAALFAVGILLALAVLGVGKCTYDRRVIANHDAKREAQTAKADRKADAKAAEQRRADDARAVDETQEIKETIREAQANGSDGRAEYYRCVGLQQAARARNQPSPEC